MVVSLQNWIAQFDCRKTFRKYHINTCQAGLQYWLYKDLKAGYQTVNLSLRISFPWGSLEITLSVRI